MGTFRGIAGTFFGVSIAVASLAMVILNSPLMTVETNLRQVYLWTLGFLLGVFVFGWSVSKLVSG